MEIKTEICENIPTSSAPVSLRSLFKDMNHQMQKIESFSNEKMESLQTSNKELKTDNENLQKENEKLKSLLAAKERDFNLYYNQYQNIAKEFEDFKARANQTLVVEPLEDVNPVNNDETLSETLLFTTPDKDTVETSSNLIPSITTNNESQLVPQSIANISNSEPRKILKARKRSRASTADADGPSKKISKSSPIPIHVKCSICPKESREVILYDDIHDYRNHVIQIHPKRYLCDRCPYHASSNIDLKRHTHNVHSLSIQSVGFDCALCHISYSRMNLLNQHINLYH